MYLVKVNEDIDDIPNKNEGHTFVHLNVSIAAFGKEDKETTAIVTDLKAEQDWFLDFGTSSHVTYNNSLLTNMTSFSISNIKTARG